MAVRLLARLLNVAALVPADGVTEHSLLVVSIHLLYPGLHELKDWNRGVILIIELGDKVGFLQHLQALSY